MYAKPAPATWQCARARCKLHHRTRYLHLLDSQLNLAGCSKGRTGNRRLQHILSDTNAVLLATGMRDISGYVRRKKNPADRASRRLLGPGGWLQKWGGGGAGDTGEMSRDRLSLLLQLWASAVRSGAKGGTST